MRDGADTRLIVEDMRQAGLSGVVNLQDLMEYTGKGRKWCLARFGNVNGGISVVTAARVLGRLYDDKR